ncbi:MAG: D-tyrosyl-tRNA(Tyr) deacylase [Nocardioidaceae bacterium]|nr:D-tyrosyl-tRNA(Tyr) deacylase [Nocardioidaceae bacterium]
MRAVISRVTRAEVCVDNVTSAQIDGPGLLVLLGVSHSDSHSDAAALANKVWQLRIMRGEESAAGLDAPLLVISQFTLYGDTRKGRRPSWSSAAPATVAEPLYEAFCSALTDLGATVGRGIFGADMAVSSTNDGPVTVIVDT